jgi:molecular chaperone HscB
MNYFEYYALPVRFGIDRDLLRSTYFERSKKFHPDFFANETESVKEEMLAQSTLNNNAYKVLNNDAARLKYVLEVTGTLSDKEKEILPPDFLMEMMELNEALMEMDPAALPGIESRVAEVEKELAEELNMHCNAFDSGGNHSILEQIKTAYLKQKYLLRIRESMRKFAAL